MIRHHIRQILPERAYTRLRGAMARRKRRHLRDVPFGQDDLLHVLKDICGVKRGDVLFVHSSMDGLATAMSPQQILRALLEVLGPEGTILMPSYPKLSSYAFLKSGQRWNVRRTPSYSGLLTEVFRRTEGTRRSLHPTKSVAVRGPLRDEMISEHHVDIRPYASNSPYGKFVANGGKAIGLGVSARYIAFIHAIDDYLAERFPRKVYRDEVLSGMVIDYSGRAVEVATLAHDLGKIRCDPVNFLRRHIPRRQADSLIYKDRPFFYADGKTVFEEGVKLAQQGTTVYARRLRGYCRKVVELLPARRASTSESD